MLMLITGWFWDAQETFPDPKKLSEELHRIGFKGIWMLDPGIKVEEGYEAYDTGSQKDVWIQTATGKQYVGMFHLETIHYWLKNVLVFNCFYIQRAYFHPVLCR